jgi:hypothetical protein
MGTVLVSPKLVIRQVAQSIPLNCRANIVIVGSLAVGYNLLPREPQYPVRTKDIDCVLSPRIEAVGRSQEIVHELIGAGWTHRSEGEFGLPGKPSTPTYLLPAIRLYPPNSADGWWLEFLTEPAPEMEDGRTFQRVSLGAGDFGIPSFTYTSLAVYKAVMSEYGIFIARPDMMALANMLEHQHIKPDPVKGLYYKDREVKRSNKDLGRVLAVAWLSEERAIEEWPSVWREGLVNCFPERWRALAAVAGNGIIELIGSRDDMEEAVEQCQYGLLTNQNVSYDNLKSTAERVLVYAVEPLKKMAE